MSWSVEEKELGIIGATESWDRISADTLIDKAMGADFNTPGVDVLYFDMGSISVLWSGADATDATLKLAASIDGTNYCELPDTEITVGAAAGCQLWHLCDIGFRFLRVEFTANANTAGTANFRYLLKSRR